MGHTYINIKGIEGDIELQGNPKMVDQGIGPYECHGYKGYHQDFQPELEEIEWDRSLNTDEQNLMILQYVHANFDKLSQEIMDNHYWTE